MQYKTLLVRLGLQQCRLPFCSSYCLTMTGSKMLLLSCLALLSGTSLSKNLVFENHSGSTIWVGSLGNDGKPPINDGGWALDAGASMSVDVDDSYAGRVWGRTGCNFDGDGNGHCDTGDCGDRLLCGGNGGAPPATLTEFTFNGAGGLDFYDISLVDGFNMPVSMTPTGGGGDGSQYSCTSTSCAFDINSDCPDELRLTVGDSTVGCKSACLAFGTDEFCCAGAHDTPETCRSSDWPKDYPTFFKNRCPDAYSYAYDDHKSTFTCANTGYTIVFG